MVPAERPASSEAVVRLARTFRSRSPEATEALAAALAANLADLLERSSALRRRGVAISLEGDLGAGKTAFVRGAARGLGSTDSVHSPSFTLMHTYAGRVPIYHFDAWMEGRERAFLDGGGAEWLEGGGLALVEWGGRVEPWLPLPRIRVRLALGAELDERRIAVEVLGADASRTGTDPSNPGEDLLALLLAAVRAPVPATRPTPRPAAGEASGEPSGVPGSGAGPGRLAAQGPGHDRQGGPGPTLAPGDLTEAP